MKKRAAIVVPLLSLTCLLGACNTAITSGNIDAMNQQQSSVVLEKATGTFQGKFEDKYMDVTVDGAKKMYSYVGEVSSIVDELKENEKISIAYEKNDKGEMIVHLVTRLNGSIAITKDETQKEEEAEVETEVQEGDSPYDVDVELGFTLKDNVVYLLEDSELHATIETLPYDTEIVKERWRASPILKDIGELKEISNNYIPGTNFERAEFVFAGYGEETTGYIAVKWIDHELYRFTINVPKGDTYKEKEVQLWNMLATVKKKD